MRKTHFFVVPLLVSCFVLQGVAGDKGRVIRSAAFPGMGQLGDGQVARGLLYMSGEVALLTLSFSSLGKSAAYARNTKYDSVYINHEGGRSEDLQAKKAEWSESVDLSAKYKTRAIAFGGVAIVWWAWNVVDGIFFGPKAEPDVEPAEGAMLRKIRENTMLAVGPDGAGVVYKVNF